MSTDLLIGMQAFRRMNTDLLIGMQAFYLQEYRCEQSDDVHDDECARQILASPAFSLLFLARVIEDHCLLDCCWGIHN